MGGLLCQDERLHKVARALPAPVRHAAVNEYEHGVLHAVLRVDRKDGHLALVVALLFDLCRNVLRGGRGERKEGEATATAIGVGIVLACAKGRSEALGHAKCQTTTYLDTGSRVLLRGLGIL